MIARRLGGRAVLFYGSVLRTGDFEGVLDFYVLTGAATGSGLRRLLGRWLWPDVSYHEIQVGGRMVRVKVATMPLDTFERACAGMLIDTTIWARFVQPAAIAWADGAESRAAVAAAVAQAAKTAAGFAALLGPAHGVASDYWKALFAHTYATELRVEPAGREDQILAHDRTSYDRLLPLAWAAARIRFDDDAGMLAPQLSAQEHSRLAKAWRVRRAAGKPLNAARLVKAAFTFDGAARYGLWKIERHTGMKFALTPWRARHPILAAPGVLWQVWRTAGQK